MEVCIIIKEVSNHIQGSTQERRRCVLQSENGHLQSDTWRTLAWNFIAITSSRKYLSCRKVRNYNWNKMYYFRWMHCMYRISRLTQLTWRLKTIQLPYSCPVCHITNKRQSFLFAGGSGVGGFFVFLFFFFFSVLMLFLCTGAWIMLGI